MALTERQKEGIDTLVQFLLGPDNRFTLTGVSGSGKTEVITDLMKVLPSIQQMHKLIVGSTFKADIVLCATTHKAGNELFQRTGHPVTTIHSLLGLRQHINYNTGKISYVPSRQTKSIKNKIIIIDESSMIDIKMEKLIEQYLGKCKIIYVLDKYQATPVNCKYVPVVSNGFPNFHLGDPVRYDKDSHIDNVSSELRQLIDGKLSDWPNLADNKMIVSCTGKEFQHKIHQCMGNVNHKESDGKILAWTNAKVLEYNDYCRGLHHTSNTYNPGEHLILRGAILENGAVKLRNEQHILISSVNTTVQTYFKVDYYTAEVKSINGRKLHVKIPYDRNQLTHVLNSLKGHSWYDYYSLKEMMLDARSVFASTIHCSQGSTYDDVYIDIGDLARNTNANEVARLLYVAITRARNKVYLHGYAKH